VAEHAGHRQPVPAPIEPEQYVFWQPAARAASGDQGKCGSAKTAIRVKRLTSFARSRHNKNLYFIFFFNHILTTMSFVVAFVIHFVNVKTRATLESLLWGYHSMD
jgi:hypothetical protein